MSRLAVLICCLGLTLNEQVIEGPAGTYTVTTTGPTKVTSGETWVRIEWSNEAVPAPPVKPVEPPVEKPPVVTPNPPQPGPTTPETPLTGPVWAVAIYEEAKIAGYPAGQQNLLGSKTIGPALKQLDIYWQVRKSTDPILQDGWLKDAEGKGLPALLTVAAAGKLSIPAALPPDENAVIAYYRKLRGQ